MGELTVVSSDDEEFVVIEAPEGYEDDYPLVEEEEVIEPEYITLSDENYVPTRVREQVGNPDTALGYRLVLPPRPYEHPYDIPLNGQRKFVYIRRDTEDVRICDILPITGYNITDHYLTLSTEYVRQR